jgi:hypothetical protein
VRMIYRADSRDCWLHRLRACAKTLLAQQRKRKAPLSPGLIL